MAWAGMELATGNGQQDFQLSSQVLFCFAMAMIAVIVRLGLNI
jgi:hypothetical protein